MSKKIKDNKDSKRKEKDYTSQSQPPISSIVIDRSNNPNNTEEKTAKEQQIVERSHKQEKTKVIEWITLFATIATAVGAIWAVFVSQKAIELTQEQFTTANRPFLQIRDLKISGDTLYYSIANLGAYSAHITSGTAGVVRGDIDIEMNIMPDTLKRFDGGEAINPKLINQYIVRDFPVAQFVSSKPFEDNIKYTNPSLYFVGKIFYTDEGTGNKQAYIFRILLPSFEFKMNINMEPKQLHF